MRHHRVNVRLKSGVRTLQRIPISSEQGRGRGTVKDQGAHEALGALEPISLAWRRRVDLVHQEDERLQLVWAGVER